MKKRLVLKLGTSTLTAGSHQISFGKLEDISRQIVELKEKYDIIIVSSVAIAASKQFVQINNAGSEIHAKQALSAIGQPRLMRIYDQVFSSFGLHIAQCLLTYRDFENTTAVQNTKNTIQTLIENDFIPIINENDTVATEEIVLGDNDKLSALVAVTMDVDLLVIASDIDGLFDKNPFLDSEAKFISEVTDLKTVQGFAQEKESKLGTGGMTTKFKAIAITASTKVETWLVNGQLPNFLVLAMANKIRFTRFKV